MGYGPLPAGFGVLPAPMCAAAPVVGVGKVSGAAGPQALTSAGRPAAAHRRKARRDRLLMLLAGIAMLEAKDTGNPVQIWLRDPLYTTVGGQGAGAFESEPVDRAEGERNACGPSRQASRWLRRGRAVHRCP